MVQVSVSKVQHPKGRRVGVVTDRSLLRILIVAAGLVALAVVVVPLLDDDHGSFPLPDPNQDKNEHVAPKTKAMTLHGNNDKRAKANPSKGSKVRYHTVFSSGCSTFQDWQSYVFFYHLLHSGQEGPVTRIASGCTDEDAKTLQEIFEKEIAVMAPGRFRLHLTPDFSHIKPGYRFKYVSGDGLQ